MQGGKIENHAEGVDGIKPAAWMKEGRTGI